MANTSVVVKLLYYVDTATYRNDQNRIIELTSSIPCITHQHFHSRPPGCGGVLRNSFGTISSPNSPDRYPGNSDCTWVIEAPPGYVIQLAWQMFVLESHENCQFDYVEIFDNSTTASGDQASR